jgi:hypothetical protein
MRKRRGSAVVMSLILVAAITTVIAADITLTTAGLRFQSSAERQRQAAYAFEGAVVQVVEDFYDDDITVPCSKSYTVGDLTCAVTVADNSANVVRTLKIDGQVAVKGKTYSYSRVVGARHDPSPFAYALAVDKGLDTTQKLITGTGGSKGDVYSGADLLLHSSTNTLNGDAECVKTFHGPYTTVTGDTIEGASALKFPKVKKDDYKAAADVTYTFASMNGYSFGSGGAYYPLIYCDSSLFIKGTFSGKGTIFVHGNVTIYASTYYADSNSEVAIICDGDLFFETIVVSAVGYLFAPGNTISQGPMGVNVTRGSIVTGNLYWNGTMNVVHDPAVWDSPTEGKKLRLPGMWP